MAPRVVYSFADRPCQQCGEPLSRIWPCGRLRSPAEYNRLVFCTPTCVRAYRAEHPPERTGWKKTGPKAVPPEERFWRYVAKDGPVWAGRPCWSWTGTRNRTGYGTFMVAKHRKHVPAHRYAYELLVGPIPVGYDVDHLCRNRCCVNPAHLEPVTRAENIRRGYAHRRQLAHIE